jgi:hypothetical protein
MSNILHLTKAMLQMHHSFSVFLVLTSRCKERCLNAIFLLQRKHYNLQKKNVSKHTTMFIVLELLKFCAQYFLPVPEMN